MKIRTQFVSNSSSSSFILTTTFETEDEFYEKWKKLISELLNWNVDYENYKDIKSFAKISFVDGKIKLETIHSNSIPSDVTDLLWILGVE